MSQPKVKRKCQPREPVDDSVLCALCGAVPEVIGVFEPNAAFSTRMGWDRHEKPVRGVCYALCMSCHQRPTVATDVERVIVERMGPIA